MELNFKIAYQNARDSESHPVSMCPHFGRKNVETEHVEQISS